MYRVYRAYRVYRVYKVKGLQGLARGTEQAQGSRHQRQLTKTTLLFQLTYPKTLKPVFETGLPKPYKPLS